MQLAVLGTGRTVPIWPAARHLSAAKWSTAAAEGTKPWCVGYCVAVGRARRDEAGRQFHLALLGVHVGLTAELLLPLRIALSWSANALVEWGAQALS